MELEHVQQNVDSWIHQHGGYWDKFQILARLSEELGEVASALQRIEGLQQVFEKYDIRDGEAWKAKKN